MSICHSNDHCPSPTQARLWAAPLIFSFTCRHPSGGSLCTVNGIPHHTATRLALQSLGCLQAQLHHQANWSLWLQDLGEPSSTVTALLDALLANNNALRQPRTRSRGKAGAAPGLSSGCPTSTSTSHTGSATHALGSSDALSVETAVGERRDADISIVASRIDTGAVLRSMLHLQINLVPNVWDGTQCKHLVETVITLACDTSSNLEPRLS